MTYNVQSGGVGREGLIREVIQSIGPDVGVFTETTVEESFTTMANAVGPHHIMAPYRPGRTRVAVASRWPIVWSEPHGPRWSRRKWLEVRLRPHRGPVVAVHAVHLVSQPLWPLELWRRHEVRHLLHRLHAHAGARHVVAGDFNSLMPGDLQHQSGAPLWVRAQWLLQGGGTPRWALQGLIDAGYTDCYRTCHPNDNGFTVPARNPGARIDYVFASSELRSSVLASDTHFARSDQGHASDHVPVWADFEWPSSRDHVADEAGQEAERGEF